MGEPKPKHAPGAVVRARRLRREMTFAERKLWERLRKLDLHFRKQAPVGPYIADFAQHSAKLIIEVDGPLHGTLEAQAHDATRTAWLKSQGYRVIRFTGRQVVESPHEVMTAIMPLTSPAQSKSPFPLDGGRGGDGGDSLSAESSSGRANSARRDAEPLPTNTAPADGPSPPSQPFPHQGGRASGSELS